MITNKPGCCMGSICYNFVAEQIFSKHVIPGRNNLFAIVFISL